MPAILTSDICFLIFGFGLSTFGGYYGYFNQDLAIILPSSLELA